MIFDNEQKRAIKHIDGPLLVIAGPGSGKTATMIERLHTMINKHYINQERILVITFSRAAANEMRERFHKRIDNTAHKITFGTFHSVFLNMLKGFFIDFNIDIISEEQRRYFLVEILHNIGYEFVLTDFIDELLLDITLFKNSNSPISSYLPFSCDNNMFTRIYTALEEKMLKNQYMDFDDIIILTNRLLCNNASFLNTMRHRYDYVLIDEFQDINQLQFDCIYMITKNHRNVFAVGDEDQSIYGFRGSKPDIMMDFNKYYNNAELIYLKNNYRSGKEIVLSAKRLISHNKNRYIKDFNAVNKFNSKVSVFKYKNMNEQLKHINKILKTSSNIDFAIICRTNSEKTYFKRNTLAKNVLTMHESKGLEFDTIWIPNVNKGNCPYEHKLYECNIEEERRLFYVAITRAKKNIYISYCTEKKNKRVKKSKFIKEL